MSSLASQRASDRHFPAARRASILRKVPAVIGIGVSALAFLLPLFPTIASAAQVTLAWEAPQHPGIAGYKLYYGYVRDSYEGAIDVGTETTYTLTDLEDGQPYYFTVAAYDANGEQSELASEVALNGFPDVDEETDPEESDQVETDRDAPWEDGDESDVADQDAANAVEHDAEPAQEDTEVGADPEVVPPSQLKVVYVDSEPARGDGAAEAAIDGRAETFWHTEMGAKAPIHPHELGVDLGGEYSVRGFRYLPRQDGKTDGMVGRYSFYVSEDGEEWGEAVATGMFSRGTGEQEVTFPEKIGSYVRFVAHSEVNGKPWTSVAAITILGVR
jgi:hypothetical protein